jgi:hypothetical protein
MVFSFFVCPQTADKMCFAWPLLLLFLIPVPHSTGTWSGRQYSSIEIDFDEKPRFSYFFQTLGTGTGSFDASLHIAPIPGTYLPVYRIQSIPVLYLQELLLVGRKRLIKPCLALGGSLLGIPLLKQVQCWGKFCMVRFWKLRNQLLLFPPFLDIILFWFFWLSPFSGFVKPLLVPGTDTYFRANHNLCCMCNTFLCYWYNAVYRY